MGITFLFGVFCGVAGWEFFKEARYWQRRCNEPEPEPKPEPDYRDMTVDDLLDESIIHNLALLNIERTVCSRVGARPGSDEADLIMEAVYDGRKWDEVREMCEGHLWT